MNETLQQAKVIASNLFIESWNKESNEGYKAEKWVQQGRAA